MIRYAVNTLDTQVCELYRQDVNKAFQATMATMATRRKRKTGTEPRGLCDSRGASAGLLRVLAVARSPLPDS